MLQSDFQKLFDERVAKLIETGKIKGVKYTVSAEDRLANFKALEPRLSPLQVWEVFFSKHWSAIQYYLTTGKNIGEDICDTHIHDCIMYLFLLEGLVKEKSRVDPKNDVYSGWVMCTKCETQFAVVAFDLSNPGYCPHCKISRFLTRYPVNR